MIKFESQGFELDDANSEKCQKHGLTQTDIENLFQGKPMIVVFTLRTINKEVLIRPISARYMHQKEARKYEEEITKI